MVLDFHEEALAAKDFGELDGVVARLIRPLIQKIVRQRAAEASRSGDDAFLVLGEHVDINARPVVVPIETRIRRELHQIPVARLVFGQQQQVIRLPPSLALGVGRVRRWRSSLSIREIGFHPDDRMQSRFAELLVEIVGRIHHAVVGDGQMLNARFLGLFDVFRNPSHAIEQGIFGV